MRLLDRHGRVYGFTERWSVTRRDRLRQPPGSESTISIVSAEFRNPCLAEVIAKLIMQFPLRQRWPLATHTSACHAPRGVHPLHRVATPAVAASVG